MAKVRLNELLDSAEGPDLEVKAAQGGLPGDFWETYSAFANTGGGTVLLGVKEDGGRLIPAGVPNIGRVKKSLLDSLNDRSKVSANVLLGNSVEEVEVEGKRLLRVDVPEAPRNVKPVYINGNVMTGTFKRIGGSDYRCSPDDVRRMMAESLGTRDDRILSTLSLADLDGGSVAAYRNLFRSANPDHPWLALDDVPFLSQLGAWTIDRESGATGPTLAGVLMFGSQATLLEVFPRYQVDYRESDDEDPDVRWTYRHTVDGRWSPNLFEFYQRTVSRLTRDIAIPFRLQGLQRIDDSHVSEALREALVNCLVHADYEAGGGITVVRARRYFRFENPGDVRVGVDQAFVGGVSDCRNPALQRMFRMAGFGEQAGSGIPRILRAWEEQSWRWPDLFEDKERYRTALFLLTESMLPEESIERLRARLGQSTFEGLDKDDVVALVTADIEGQVTKGRLVHLTQRHPTDAAAILRRLAERGLLEALPSRRVYTLPRAGAESSQLSLLSSTHLGPSSTHSAGNSTVTGPSGADEGWRLLQQLAEPVARRGRQDRQIVREAIIAMCRVRPLRPAELANLLNRSAQALRQQYLNSLLDEGRLRYLYPGEPTHPNQAYVARDAGEQHG
jgi:predicted HTH transcriptional regulator